jgi:uncharacterized protein
MDRPARVTATPAALALLERLEREHGPLMFHQSGGCCDGSSPMCYPRGELIVGDADVLLGEVGGQPFYMSAAQYRLWKKTRLVLDVVAGRGGMFSLEGPTGQRFHIRSEPFSEADWRALVAAESAFAAE